MKAILIAGTKSGVGKTTITLGLLGALKSRGLKVQAFKVGPDFIDPGLHAILTGIPSHNLDTWMLPNEENIKIFSKYANLSDISVLEGVMGLFDGAPGSAERGSTAHLAKILEVPVVLVIDCHGLARSILPLIKGFLEYDRAVPIKGIILNRVGSPNHEAFLRRIIASDFPELNVIGAIPRKDEMLIPSRHLGLFTAGEIKDDIGIINEITDRISKAVDLDTLLEIAWKGERIPCETSGKTIGVFSTPEVTIGVPMDEAFCFYYEENLEALRRAGAKIVRFSPLRDERLPEIDAIYIGGGYPELYAKELSQNTSIIGELRKRVLNGMPCYGECGGMMYLSRGIYLEGGDFYPMLGVLPFSVRMLPFLKSLGYREVEFLRDTILGTRGLRARGHEFHYSERVDELSIEHCAYSSKNALGKAMGDKGFVEGNILSSYVHLHFLSNREIARNFVNRIKETIG